MGLLIKLRHKYQTIVESIVKEAQAVERKARKALEVPEDEDAKIDRELDETMKRIEKEKKRKDKKEKIANDKTELRKKMSVIATTTLDNDEDLVMSRKLWDDIRKKGFEGAGDKSSDDSDSSEEEKGEESAAQEEDESSEDELDEKERAVAMMADQMEDQISKHKEYAMSMDRRMVGKEAKKKALIEQQRLRLEDLEEKEALDNAGLLDDDSELDEDDKLYKKAEAEDEEKKIVEGMDVESSGESDDEGLGLDAKGLFVNPLAKKNAAKEESEEWSDDDKYDKLDAKKKKKKDKDAILGKRKRKGSHDDVGDFFKKDDIEEVPANDPGTLQQQDGYESMDSTDIAETRILARKMLRKKARNEIIEGSYNRYTTHEAPDSLPSWFVEDEARHRFCERLRPTKEEIA